MKSNDPLRARHCHGMTSKIYTAASYDSYIHAIKKVLKKIEKDDCPDIQAINIGFYEGVYDATVIVADWNE